MGYLYLLKYIIHMYVILSNKGHIKYLTLYFQTYWHKLFI